MSDARTKAMPDWLFLILMFAALGVFVWLSDNPATSGATMLAVLWTVRAVVAYFVWSFANRVFKASMTPWRSALRGIAWVLGIALIAALRAGCTSDPDCDADYGSCGSICDSVTSGYRTEAGVRVGLFLMLPIGFAAWQNRAKFIGADQARPSS